MLPPVIGSHRRTFWSPDPTATRACRVAMGDSDMLYTGNGISNWHTTFTTRHTTRHTMCEEEQVVDRLGEGRRVPVARWCPTR